MSFVIRHPRRGVYIGRKRSEFLDKIIPRFSLKLDRVDGGEQFPTASAARQELEKLTAEQPKLRWCYVIDNNDSRRSKP